MLQVSMKERKNFNVIFVILSLEKDPTILSEITVQKISEVTKKTKSSKKSEKQRLRSKKYYLEKKRLKQKSKKDDEESILGT